MRRGWRPIRLHGLNPKTGLCTCSEGDHNSAGKHPVDSAWQNTPPMSEAEIDQAWSGWREHCNVGIATGKPSGFFVLDVDPDAGGADSVKRLQADHGKLPKTVMQKTGSGGWHLLFQMPTDFDVTNSNKALVKLYPGLDIRGTGGQIVAAPSRAPKGAYTWLSEPDAEPEPAPGLLLDLLRPAQPDRDLVTSAIEIPEGDEETARCELYSASVRDAEVTRLTIMAENAVGPEARYIGEPWNETTFAVSCALLELANSPWTLYSGGQARIDVWQNAPRDAGFTYTDIEARWDSAVSTVGDRGRPYPAKREEASAEWGAEPGVRVDPILLGGVVAPAREDEPLPRPLRSWDDLGNAMRIVDHFGKALRWVAEAEKWAVFRGGRWRVVQNNVVQGYVQRMIHEIIPATEAQQYSSDLIGDPPAEGDEDTRTSERDAFLKWLKAQRMSARITAAQQEAKGRHELHVSISDFDADPMLLNVANGVIDLRTGRREDPRPEHMLMRQSPVAYDPEARAPIWDAFLERMQPDPQMRAYLQRCLGYSLSGHIREQAFFIHHGDGANGKSICTEAVGAVMGEYGQTVASSTLLSSANEEHPAGIAMMQGKRWLPATETAPGKRLDEEKVKNLTGDARITARFMGKDWFEFEPSGKIHLVTNHLPFLSDAKSIWRRIHLIRWAVSLAEKEWDRALGTKLQGELPGILNWLLDGCLEWQKQGLNPPEVALGDKADYRGDSDVFGDFLRERTMPAPGTRVPTENIYRAYSNWCFDQGIRRPMSQPSFVATMTERKIPRFKDARQRGFKDIMVVAPAVAPVIAPVPWEN